MTRFGTAVLCSAFAACALAEGNDFVKALSSVDFEGFIKTNPVALVEFYAPWCGHCKRLEPEYEAAAEHFHSKDLPVKLAKVDATVETELATAADVQGFPTIYLYREGVKQPYTGGRTKNEIIEWIEKMTGPAVILGSHEENVKAQQADEATTAFIGEFKANDAPGFKAFEAIANLNREAGKFYASFSAKTEQVTVYRHNEESVSTKDVDEKKLAAFVALESVPLLGKISGETYSMYAKRSENWFWFAGEEANTKEYGAAIRGVSNNYRTEYNFVFLDINQFRAHAEQALGMTKFPAVAIQTENSRFLYDGPLDEKSLTHWVEDVRAGKVERHLRSDEIPATNDEPVKVVVGKNFKELVLQDKDVLLMIYAPWCGHCKKLEPIYDQMAKSLQQNDKLVIAKMDGTTNESPVEGFDITGFPTLYFVPAGAEKPITYDGQRTAEDMVAFLKKHAVNPIVLESAVSKDEL